MTSCTKAPDQEIVNDLLRLLRWAFDDEDSEISGYAWNMEAEALLARIIETVRGHDGPAQSERNLYGS
jgi:hypothetical protein